MKLSFQFLVWLAVLLSTAAYWCLAYHIPRSSFLLTATAFGVVLAAYVVLLRSGISWRWGVGLAFFFRLLWLVSAPALSDDYYRFRWDGLLVANNISPFQLRPSELIISDSITAPLATQSKLLSHELANLYPQLNSPAYYSVYPPVCQFIFGFAAKVFPQSETGFILILRLCLLAAEGGSTWLMLQLLASIGWPRERGLLYLLHPLAITETTGNLHFEGLVIFLVLLAVWLVSLQRWRSSAVVLALGAGTKLLPILILPLLIKRLPYQRFIVYATIFTTSLALLFTPFISADLLLHLSQSLRLYFHRFEFNASLYYLLRTIGFQLTGYNEIALIGPALALASGLISSLIIWREKRLSYAHRAPTLLFILTIYYLCATTVHPWYLTMLVALSVFTRFTYPLVWGGLAVLSYATYRDASYTENLWLVGLEYTITLLVLGYELVFPPRPTTALLPTPRP
jgi:hypothetical protein